LYDVCFIYFIALQQVTSGVFDHLLEDIKIIDRHHEKQRSITTEETTTAQQIDTNAEEIYTTKLSSFMCESNFLPKLLKRKLKYGGIAPSIYLR